MSTDLDDQQRCGVARELVRAGDAVKVHVLLEILADENEFARVHAAESLYKVGAIGDGVALQEAFESGDSAALRLMAAAALGKAGDRQAMVLLRDSLRAEDPDTYRLAAWVLGRIGSTEDIEPIRDRLANAPTPLARAFLQHALAALGDKKGLAALAANLSSEEPAVRASAATFAGDARAVSLAPRLLEMLNDSDLDARIRAAQSLLDLANRK
jgi:sialidase-1